MTSLTQLSVPAASEDRSSDHRDHSIGAVTATIVDLPLRRPHFHATGTHAGQSLVVIELITSGRRCRLGGRRDAGRYCFLGGECVWFPSS